MAIAATSSKLHWNYFLALERDLALLSRYVEFCKPNFKVFSIELAHMLFAAASEVDVVAKLLCRRITPAASPGTIDEYRGILVNAIPELPTTVVVVPRYGLSFTPWSIWTRERSPNWWRSYNKVKHERDAHFSEATLEHALGALGALLILAFHYYSRALATPPTDVLPPKDTTLQLKPASTLLRLDESFYYEEIYD